MEGHAQAERKIVRVKKQHGDIKIGEISPNN
jgi:hypothetical protein